MGRHGCQRVEGGPPAAAAAWAHDEAGCPATFGLGQAEQRSRHEDQCEWGRGPASWSARRSKSCSGDGGGGGGGGGSGSKRRRKR